MDRQQQINELNALPEATLRVQYELLQTLIFPSVSPAANYPTIDIVRGAKEKALRLFDPVGAAVGITSREGQLALRVSFQHIPSDVSIEEIQAMIDQNREIDGVPVVYRVTGIDRSQ